MNGKIKTNKSP